MTFVMVLALQTGLTLPALAAASAAPVVPLAASKPAPHGVIIALLPEDLGPAAIDVSGYPEEHRKTYEDIFVPMLSLPGLGGTARYVNSPLIELDAKAQDAERAAHPGLFADPALSVVSKDGWRKAVDAIRLRPPCCGACPVLNRADAIRLWKFLAYDSTVRKTGAHAESWLSHRRKLLEDFRAAHPERYRELFPDRPSAPNKEVAP